MNYLPPVAPVVYRPAPVEPRKSVGVALVISFLLPPGFAHLYIGRPWIGLALFVAWCFGVLLTLTIIGAILGVPLMVGTWVFGIIHSAVTARPVARTP